MLEGIDCASPPDVTAIVAAGKQFIIRYLAPIGDPRATSRAEIDSYLSSGLGVGFVYEETGLELTGGYAAGVRVATVAAVLRDSLSLPVDTVIYFTADTNVVGSVLLTCVDAIDGAASVLGFEQTGGYGSAAFIDAIAGHCKHAWQTYGWSNGRVSVNADIYQYLNGQTIGGHAVDYCKTLSDNTGLMMPDSERLDIMDSVILMRNSGGTIYPTYLDNDIRVKGVPLTQTEWNNYWAANKWPYVNVTQATIDALPNR